MRSPSSRAARFATFAAGVATIALLAPVAASPIPPASRLVGGASHPDQAVPQAECDLTGNRTVAPAGVQAGQPVTVTLAVSGACQVRGGPLHVVLAIDAWLQPTGDRLDKVKAAATRLVEQLGVTRGGYVRVGVVEYGAEARTACRATDRTDRLKDCIDGVGVPGGLVSMDKGIAQAMLVLVQARRDFEPPDPGREVIVLFGDRNQAGCDAPLLTAAEARGQQMVVASVCIARSCDVACLQAIADPGRHHHIDDTTALEADLLAMRNVLQPATIDYVNLTDTLPEGLAPVPLSARPAARQSGQTLEWEIRTAAPVTATTAITVSFSAVPGTAGRLASSTGATAVRVAIGRNWFSPDVAFPVPEIEVSAPPTAMPTPDTRTRFSLFLPRNLARPIGSTAGR